MLVGEEKVFVQVSSVCSNNQIDVRQIRRRKPN